MIFIQYNTHLFKFYFYPKATLGSLFLNRPPCIMIGLRLNFIFNRLLEIVVISVEIMFRVLFKE